MPISETSGGIAGIRSDPPESDTIADIWPDPLLKSGTFIDDTVTNGRTLVGANGNADAVAGNSNCAEGSTPLPGTESTQSPVESTTRWTKRRGSEQSAVRALSDTPDWLPPGWLVEDKVRSAGATAGVIDKYYVDPSGHRFRSKKEVFFFLETGTKRKRKLKENTDGDTTSLGSSGGHKQKASSPGSKSAVVLNFNFANVPEKVKWVLTDASGGSWSPYIGDDERVPESSKQEWAAAFASLAKRYSDGKGF